MYVGGNLRAIRSNIRHNRATGSFGGAYVLGSLTARHANISDNFARGSVSAIGFGGDGEITNSTIANNTTQYYFVMNFGGHTRIVNSTISGNSASFGAGINMGDIHNLTITNSTIAFNRERPRRYQWLPERSGLVRRVQSR